MALSNAYARSDEILAGNIADDRFYSRYFRRRMEPEVLADMIADVTGIPDPYGGHPLGSRAVSILDPLTPADSLNTLGRCSRADNCQGSTLGAAKLSTQLHLLNGELVNRKLIDADGHLQRLLRAGATNADIVEDFFLRGLSRPPTAEERMHWCARIAASSAEEHAERCEDFVWSLLKSGAFIENH
jgi:hypothetical protein